MLIKRFCRSLLSVVACSVCSAWAVQLYSHLTWLVLAYVLFHLLNPHANVWFAYDHKQFIVIYHNLDKRPFNSHQFLLLPAVILLFFSFRLRPFFKKSHCLHFENDFQQSFAFQLLFWGQWQFVSNLQPNWPHWTHTYTFSICALMCVAARLYVGMLKRTL